MSSNRSLIEMAQRGELCPRCENDPRCTECDGTGRITSSTALALAHRLERLDGAVRAWLAADDALRLTTTASVDACNAARERARQILGAP